MRTARGAVMMAAVLVAAACGSGDLTEAQRRWCAEHHPTVLDTMDVLYPWHWDGNEAFKAEARPLFEQVEDGTLTQQEANLRLAEMARRYWPKEYAEGCRTAYAGR